MPNRTLALLTLALLGAPTRAQEPEPQHLLRLAFEVGKTQYFRQTTSIHMAMAMGGQKMAASIDMVMTLSSKVTAVKDGKAEIEFVVHRIVLKADSPVPTDYDSDVAGSEPEMLEGVAELLGKPMRSKLDDRGHVSDVRMPEGVAEEALQMFGGGGMQSFLGQNVPTLPDLPIAIGGSWKTETPLSDGQLAGAKLATTNKLTKLEAGRATLEQRLEVDLSQATAPGADKMKSQESGGTLVLDLATGMPTSMDLELTMVVDGGAAGMNMTTTTTMKLQAIEPPAPKPTKPADK